MSRCLGGVGIAALLLAVAGCTLDAFLVPTAGVSGPQQVVSGSVAVVSAQLEAGLADEGVAVLTKRVGTEQRLAGITPSGKAFCLHLYEKNGAGGEKTLVRIRWGTRDSDEAFWRSVLAMLSVPARDDIRINDDNRPAKSGE
jgi:hypothetical protein